MVSRDRVAHVDKAVSTFDVPDRLDLVSYSLEEGWVVYVGGLFIPCILRTLWGFQLLPHLTTFEDIVVS
jgi:hypothetical protein